MAGSIVLRNGIRVLGTLPSGAGDPILTRDAGTKDVGSIPSIDISAYLSTTLQDRYLFVGSSSNIATPRLISGAISISNLGVADIAADYITNAHINTGAAIAYSKLNLIGSIVNNDIATAAGISRSKLAAGNTYRVIVNDGSGVLSEAGSILANRALISDGNGIPSASGVTAAQLATVDTSSSIQTQLNNRLSFSSAITPVEGDLVYYSGGAWNRLPRGTDGQILRSTSTTIEWGTAVANGLPTGGTAGQYLEKIDGTNYNTQWATLTLSKITDVTATAANVNILSGTSVTSTELGYISGLTSNAQAQLNNKLNNSLAHNSIWVGSIAGIPTPLAAGTNGYVLTIVSGSPQWQPITATFTEWSQGGNSVVSEKILGTLNSFDLPIRVNNVERLKITTAGAFTFTATSLAFSGSWAMNGVAPSATQTGWTTSNVSTDRVLNANSTSLDEVADVLCTLIEDLKTKGILAA